VKESRHIRSTHSLEDAERKINQNIKRKKASKGYLLPGEHKERNKLG
jgi:hypothetical protein